MVLPPGIDKRTGLQAALSDLSLSAHNTVGIGDAENDHALLALCEVGVAVGDALPSLKERADWVTQGGAGEGVVELATALVDDDLAFLEKRVTRHHLTLGMRESGGPFSLPPYGKGILIAGPSGSGKSQTTTTFLAELMEHGYQACVIDPEGDYGGIPGAVTVGSQEHPPSLDEVIQVLQIPTTQVVVNLLAVRLSERPRYFASILVRLQELRSRTGRPHWLLIDEAHHLLPAAWAPAPLTLPQNLVSFVAVTVHPEMVSTAALSMIDTVIARGPDPEDTLLRYARAVNIAPPAFPSPTGALEGQGAVLAWEPRSPAPPERVAVRRAKLVHHRHERKYAHGELGPRQELLLSRRGWGAQPASPQSAALSADCRWHR